jgi:hypothetical protein
MRTALVTIGLSLVLASLAQAQSPTANLPSQASSPSPMQSPTTPNSGNDEVAAKRKLEASGYRDIRSMTANPDGTFSGKATRLDPPSGVRRGSSPEVNVEIDASGNVRER